MLTAQVELLRDALPEIKTLIGQHYDDLSLHKAHGVPLRPQFQAYLDREAQGTLVLATLRRDGVMVGYKIGFVGPGLHYETCLTATPDIFFVSIEHRGGTAALRLFRCYEQELRRRGVRLWMDGSKNHKSTEQLFTALGFEATETIFSKWLT